MSGGFAAREILGIVGPEGWVPLDQYEALKALNAKLKPQALEDADSDLIRVQIQEHWPFDDQDEDE
ncbi:protein kinase subdomain-containing protein pkl cak fmp29 [Lasallia pustulata]|uniref:Protein kinase subdomain-containing protein pkl cak fmp29 n=1 Tax=Lasallia pustulata TaxID=136370 RepID=A0A1W5CSU8_9LECA|nr:protein kinase subdomain-containing protein pkl cak fmp29 [Lasallia pustulata]